MKVYIVFKTDLELYEVDSVHMTEKAANARVRYENTRKTHGIDVFVTFEVEEHEVAE